MEIREISVKWKKKRVTKKDEKRGIGKSVSSPQKVYETFLWLMESPIEVMLAVVLNTKNVVIDIIEHSKGTTNCSPVFPAEIGKAVLLRNGAGCLLVHNHPSGDAEPSQQDIDITQAVAKVTSVLSIQLMDHIIIGEGTYYSFQDSSHGSCLFDIH